MKSIALALLTLLTIQTASAQWLRPEPLQGAVWGGLIGGIVGGDRHHGFSRDGAAIGAGVGLVAGALASTARRDDNYEARGEVYSSVPQVTFGYGYGSYGSSAYVYFAPNRYCAPGYYYRPTRANYVVSGTVLGAASGALIGAADHNAGRGALIGATAGLVLGSVAEHSARRAAPPAQVSSVTPPPAAQVATPPPPITSRPVANSTYYWTARPVIADAPRVPEAPTF